MSTYYFIVCDDCMEITDAASRTAGGYCHLANSNETLLPFIIAHGEHKTRIINEHNDDYCTGDYFEWTEDNIKEQIEKAQGDGRWLSTKLGGTRRSLGLDD